ncbi:MAG: hydroxyacid dehydrogenase [Deltaproteobacteria bacterium]|nr:MAG: hydroxyacid dehydrogenase [Deltaproteobacteria bacterium]
MKPMIVVADGFDKTLFKQLCDLSDFEVFPEPKINQSILQDLLPKINGLVIRSTTKVTKELLDKASGLKYVIRAGAGTDNIDKLECQNRDVRVSNTPGANNNSAAEHAIALMMTVLRHTAAADASMKAGKWEKSKFLGSELSNKKIGIVGAGNIGQIVAKRLAGFDPQVLFFDPMVDSIDLPYAKKVEEIEEIFKTCDVVTIHVPLIDPTRNLVNEKLLSLMPAYSILINCARGGIVNEDDLFHVLNEGLIRGAGFDVFASEPLNEGSELRKLDNIVLTPHLGASTEEAQKRVGEMVINQLKEFFINNNLENEVRA